MANIWNYNVVCGVLLTVISCFGSGLFQQTVMPGFLLYVGGNNKAVGFAETLQGIASMLIAFPVAWHADKYRRSTSIRFGGFLTLVQGVLFVWAVHVSEPGSTQSYTLLSSALVLSGICNGILGGPLTALMDDSVPAGSRSEVNTANMVGANVAMAAGPLCAAAFFLKQGNAWSIDAMKTVIIAGALINTVGIVFAMTMDDSLALKEDSEAVHLQENLLAVDGAPGDGEADGEADGSGKNGSKTTKKTFFGLVGPSSIPWVMFAGELVFAMGAGMTVRFFPIFFQNECHMSPGLVNITYASLGGVMALATIAVQRISKRTGRLEVIIPSLVIGVVCTALLGALKPFYTNPWVMIPLFITRFVFMNSSNALQYSITADYTPKNMRARFMALSSISMFSWSGSAFVGGWLIDQYGYGPCFVITALFQGCAIPFFFIIYPHVAKETTLTDAVEARKAAEEKAASLRNALSSPGMIRTPSIGSNKPSVKASP